MARLYCIMIDVTFYNCTYPKNWLGKTLNDPFTMECVLRKSTDICNITITIKHDEIPRWNYVYIPSLSRYYFVETTTILGNGTYELKLHCDVLQTYEKFIRWGAGTLTSGQHATPNKYASNRNTVYDVRPQTEIKTFPNTKLFNNYINLVMVTLRGLD